MLTCLLVQPCVDNGDCSLSGKEAQQFCIFQVKVAGRFCHDVENTQELTAPADWHTNNVGRRKSFVCGCPSLPFLIVVDDERLAHLPYFAREALASLEDSSKLNQFRSTAYVPLQQIELCSVEVHTSRIASHQLDCPGDY